MSQSVLETIRAKAKSLGRKVCLTESDDPRNLRAAEKLAHLGYAKPILVGDEDAIRALAERENIALDGVLIEDVMKSPNRQKYIDTVVDLRKSKGLTPEQAGEWLKDTCVYSAAMVCAGDAHGYVSGGGNPKGYNHNTAQKTKPALQLFKTAKGNSIASAFFIMQMPDAKWGHNGVFFYADCGLNINPNEEQLAEIAVTTAKTFRQYTGAEPKVAMISCSSKGSAKDPTIEKVVQATAKAKSLAPDLLIDGELQFDAAILPEIAEKKAPGSNVAGYANILVFPDLNSGNTMYKATERLAGATAIGPLIQGLRRPFTDVSRGCSVDDIVDCAAVAAITEWAD